MPNPQAENGHIDIANEIAEALMVTQVSGYDNRVLWAIFRKTYGWHKKEDWIAFSQLEIMTKIHRSHISRSIKRLVERNIVTRIGNKLSFNKIYTQWRVLPKLVTVTKNGNSEATLPNMVTKEMLPKLDRVLPKLVRLLPKLDTTKETNTKETITKERESVQGILKTSKNSITPCNQEDLEEISKLLNIPLDEVSSKHQDILDMLEAKTFNGTKYKTIYYTLKSWLRLDLKRGYIKPPPKERYRANNGEIYDTFEEMHRVNIELEAGVRRI